MALKLKWPFDSKIIPVSSGGKFGRWGYYDKIAGFPHQGSDYGIKCNTDWWWPLSGRIDLFEKRSYGYGYYSRIHAGNGWYFGNSRIHDNKKKESKCLVKDIWLVLMNLPQEKVTSSIYK